MNIRILSLTAATLGLALTLTACAPGADPATSEPAPLASKSAPSTTTGEDIADAGAAVLPLRVVEVESKEVDGVQVNRLILTDATPLSWGELEAVLAILPSTSADKIAVVATTADGATVDVASAAVELAVPQDTYPEGALFTAADIDALR